MNKLFRTGIALLTLTVAFGAALPAAAQQTRDIRNLLAATIRSGDSEPVNLISKYGVETSDWTVPNDDVFIIQTVTVTPLEPGNGFNTLTLQIVDDEVVMTPLKWLVRNDESLQFNYEPGIVIGDGAALRVLNDAGSAGEVSVHVIGYLGQPRGVKRKANRGR